MGQPIDNRNPGARQTVEYTVSGYYDSTTIQRTDQKTVDLVYLKNCYLNRRRKALTKRGGSVTDTIPGTLGLPLGITEHIAPSNSSFIPITRQILANFNGSFYKKDGSTWSSIILSNATSFSNIMPSSFSRNGRLVVIAGGKPAQWNGVQSIDALGIPAPTTALTASVIAGPGFTVTGCRYMYTYTGDAGVESDWSPTVTVGAVTNQQVTVTRTAIASKDNIQYWNLYRTLDELGTVFYKIATIPIATTTYTDSLASTSLSVAADLQYTHLPPPDNSFITATYAARTWFVDAADPTRLVYSKPYNGSDVDIHYYPATNELYLNEPVTALLTIGNQLLAFHPRNISFIDGFDEDTFIPQPYLQGVGTVFKNSVATNGEMMVFLSEEGFIAVKNRSKVNISREIDLELQALLVGSYNTSLYASTVWNPAIRQFVFMITAFSSANAPWTNTDNGLAKSDYWVNDSAITDYWTDLDNPTPSSAVYIKMWGFDPSESAQRNSWHVYEFAQFADGNLARAYPVQMYHPVPSSDFVDPQQDDTYICYWNGSAGKMLRAFLKDVNTDDGTGITSEWLTGDITPGVQNGSQKFCSHIAFKTAYSDPTQDGLCTIKVLSDFEDPQARSFSGSLTNIESTTKLKKGLLIGSKQCINLYGIDTSQSQSKILLNQFYIHYRERYRSYK